MMQSQKGPPGCWRRLSRLVTGWTNSSAGTKPSDSRISASESRAQNWCDRCLFRRVKSWKTRSGACSSLESTLPLGCYSITWKYVKTSCSKSPNPRKIVPPTKLRLGRWETRTRLWLEICAALVVEIWVLKVVLSLVPAPVDSNLWAILMCRI